VKVLEDVLKQIQNGSGNKEQQNDSFSAGMCCLEGKLDKVEIFFLNSHIHDPVPNLGSTYYNRPACRRGRHGSLQPCFHLKGQVISYVRKKGIGFIKLFLVELEAYAQSS